MDDLLTTKQVQELLQVDRTTIYRMLKDGRLPGVKIGQQWRFPVQEVREFISGAPRNVPEESQPEVLGVLPLYCVSSIQEVFAGLADVGVVTTDKNGNPLTEISNSCRFCTLINESETGRQACIDSWRKLAQPSERRTPFQSCHAGLKYARARIDIEGEATAMLFAGQFYTSLPDEEEVAIRIQRLAEEHGLDPRELLAAASELTVLDERKHAEISAWLERVADTFERVGCERADLLNRLQRISAMSALDKDLPGIQ